MTELNVYKTYPGVGTPTFATKQSACFDLAFSALGKISYKGYNRANKAFERGFASDGSLHVMPGDRLMVPTGLIFDIPEGYSVRVHARSGMSLKQGLVLANAEGVIDSDYTEELFILVHNISDNGISISHGDRIAQGELVVREVYSIGEVSERPDLKTDRVGGMGSTGVTVLNVEPNNDLPVKRGRGRPKKVDTV